MAPVRPNTKKIVAPASAALTGLVRLLARQAAREAVATFSKATPGTEAVTGATIATDISAAARGEAEPS